MPFVLVILTFSVTMMISAFSEPNNLRVAYMQYFDIEFRVPDKRPLFNETIPLIQCMVRCVSMPLCLSVFVSYGGTCKGYYFTHRYLTGLQFWYYEEETYFYKGNAILYIYCMNVRENRRFIPTRKIIFTRATPSGKMIFS